VALPPTPPASPLEREAQAIGQGIDDLAVDPSDPVARAELERQLGEADSYRQDILYKMRSSGPDDARPYR
jgi:hypothetical protein